MKFRHFISSLAAVAALLQPLTSSLASHPSPLPDTLSPPNNYTVNYTNNNPPPTADANYFTTGQAQRVANALSNNNPAAVGNPNGNHNGFVTNGFLAPNFTGGGTQNTNIFDCAAHGGCDSGNAPADRIQLPAPGYIGATEPCIRLVIGHELFHHVQYAYINFSNWSAWGTAPVEGSARVMQDKLYSDLDTNAGCITYRGATSDWLLTPDQNLWNSSYTFALFWNYLTEQLGTTRTEPQIGVDFLQRFWQNAQTATNNGNIDFPGTLRTTVADFSKARSLEEVYQDFAIANYTKLMDVSALANSARYKYVDENEATGDVYTNVAKATNTVLGTGGVSGNATVNRWGTEYYVVRPDGTCRNKNGVIGFKADGDVLRWALVSTKGVEAVKRIDRGNTGAFARALLQRAADPYTELAAIAANTGNAAASHTFSFGCGDPRLQILDPLGSRPAYVGDKANPDRFLIRVLAQGPAELGSPSIEGLLPTDFEVFVGGVAASDQITIVSGAHVQGEYWLVVQPAPRTGADPVEYSLTVRLNAATDTEREAVIYEKKILDQVLVIDKSNSMNYPAGYEKITAARNAASLFVDAARDDDKIGVVSFNGTNNEPNDDSTVDYPLAGVTDAHRTTAKTIIDNIVASGWTSIGDGLYTATNQLNTLGDAGEDWIVLLSDGMENENKKWAQVSSMITSAGIRVNTIALGPYTDQALLQQIANQTGGTYYYVNSDSYAMRGAATLDPAANELADAYALANERQRRHQRVWDWTGNVSSSTSSTTFKLEAGGLKDALFSLNWPSGANVSLQILDPFGSPVAAGPAVAIRSDGTHVVYHLNEMTGGEYTVNVTSANLDVPFVAFLSGIPSNAVEMRVWLGQRPLQTGPLLGLYLRGLPMPILASLYDSDGPVRRAQVNANIFHPNGVRTVLPLFDDGNHGDGAADDGVFGNDYALTTIASQRGSGDFNPPAEEVPYVGNGSYRVRLNVDGEDNAGDAFHRISKTAFQIYEYMDRDKEWSQDSNSDDDGDGMPDRYEALHSCLDPNRYDDALEDPDHDGLYSRSEWEYSGTDPCNSDTDGGGESDGSEVQAEINPLDPSDDELTRPIDVEVVNWVADHLPDPPVASEANLIRYPAHPSYKWIRLLRADDTNPTGFAEVTVFSSTLYNGIYTDTGLINGRTYTYVLQGVGESAWSAVSPEFVGRPKADPLPPRGAVRIADGKPQIRSRTTPVTIDADPDTTEYMLANDIAFTSASWRPFTHTAPYSLTNVVTHTLATSSGPALVYAKFRDASGNVSMTYSDDVIVQAPRFFGIIRGIVRLIFGLPRGMHDDHEGHDAPTVPNGTLIWCANLPNTAPTLASADGSFELTDVPAGECVLRALQEGYRPQTVIVDTPENGVVTVTQEIDLVERPAGDPSQDATLADLALEPGTLGQAFISSTLSYTGIVTGELATTVVAARTHPSATVFYQSSAGLCIGASCPLIAGATALTVTVSAEDGITELRYLIDVTQVESAGSKVYVPIAYR